MGARAKHIPPYQMMCANHFELASFPWIFNFLSDIHKFTLATHFSKAKINIVKSEKTRYKLCDFYWSRILNKLKSSDFFFILELASTFFCAIHNNQMYHDGCKCLIVSFNSVFNFKINKFSPGKFDQ